MVERDEVAITAAANATSAVQASGSKAERAAAGDIVRIIKENDDADWAGSRSGTLGKIGTIVKDYERQRQTYVVEFEDGLQEQYNENWVEVVEKGTPPPTPPTPPPRDYPAKIDWECDACWPSPICIRDACETYCTATRSEYCNLKTHCEDRSSWNQYIPGKCDCSGCPGRELTMQEMFEKQCGDISGRGVCNPGEYCTYSGYSFDGDTQLMDASRFLSSGVTWCAPCLLVFVDAGDGTDGKCFKCTDDQSGPCFSLR